MNRFVIKGDIAFTPSSSRLETLKDGYITVENGIITSVSKIKPSCDREEFIDCSSKLIVPGFCDLHLHAPQYSYVGLGMDKELLDWLNTYTFPEESKYKDIEYAKTLYRVFADDLLKSSTTRIACFATIHSESTKYLMKILNESGIRGYVGKLTMDRNAPSSLLEGLPQDAINNERDFIESTIDEYENIKPIITPRFTPSCTDDTMKGLGNLAKKYNIRVQSHLSENPSEIELVRELSPNSSCYADTYYLSGLLGDINKPSIMAHCVYSLDSEDEIKLLKECGTFIAHCPQSNINVSSGIAPIREFLDMGLNVGLGSDVAGGANIDIRRAIVDAINVSKLRWRLVDSRKPQLSVIEGIYLATKGGGKYFGKVGSFEVGYEFDAVVFDDTKLLKKIDRSIEDRLSRLIYLTIDGCVMQKYVKGRRVL